MELYKTVRKQAEAVQVIDKSRFIAHVFPVESREEADAFLAEIREKYKDATHNVPAMVIGDKSQIQWGMFKFCYELPVIYDCCSFRFHQYKTGGVFVSFFVLQLSELFTSLFIVEITTVCLALIKNTLQLLFKSIKITFIDCILHSLTISFPSSFKKLSIVSTPYYIRGVLPLSDFTLKSANLSANIELFERCCSNR